MANGVTVAPPTGAFEAGDADPKPALGVLRSQQAALLDASELDDGFDEDLFGGFSSRRAAIQWYQRAGVRTIGYLEDVWPPADLVRDSVLMAALVPSAGALDPETAAAYRVKLASKALLPACTKAYRDLRKGAGEYIDDEEQSVDAEDIEADDQYVAMRPGFQVLDERQQAHLAALWGGFDSETALLSWLHDLNDSTNGEVDDGLAAAVMDDATARRHLFGQPGTPTARRYREAFAVVWVLPAFLAGVQSIDAGELAKRSARGNPTTRHGGSE